MKEDFKHGFWLTFMNLLLAYLLLTACKCNKGYIRMYKCREGLVIRIGFLLQDEYCIVELKINNYCSLVNAL